MHVRALKDSYEELMRLRNAPGAANAAATATPDAAFFDDLPRSLPTEVFLESIYNEYFKIRSYRVGAVFMAFVVVLGTILFMNRTDVSATTSKYFSNFAALQLLDVDKFRSMASIGDFYPWAAGVVENLDKAREPVRHSLSAATPYPVGMVLLRQIRGTSAICPTDNTIFSGLRQRVCVPSQSIDQEPFGPLSEPTMYKPNGQLPASAAVNAQSISGVYAGMMDGAATFERHLYFQQLGVWTPPTAAPVATNAPTATTATTTVAAPPPSSLSPNTTTTTSTSTSTTTTSSPSNNNNTVTNASSPPQLFRPTEAPSIVGKRAMLLELQREQQNDFFNGSTWSLAVDVAFVHPALRVFTVVTLLMERLPSGDLRPTVESNTFLVASLSVREPTAVFTFIADMFVASFVFFCLAELAYDVKSRVELSVSYREAIWQCFVPLIATAAQIITLSVVVVGRFRIWSLVASASTTIEASTTDPEKAARTSLHALSQISSLLQMSYRFFGVSLLLCLFRLLVFSESLDGLNMLSRAVRLNGSELVTVLLLAGVVTIMFGIAGNCFFDEEYVHFSTIRSTVSMLTRMLSSSGTDAWLALGETAPRQAFFFFIAFFFTLWIVLLNMVLAIVVAAVEAVQRTSTEGANFDTTWAVIKRHVLLLGRFYSNSRISTEALRRSGAAVAAAAAGTKAPLPHKLRYAKWKQDYQTRYIAVENAKKWAVDGRKTVDYNELNLVLNSVPEALRHELYVVAAEMYKTKQALGATRSKTADETEVASKNIERQLLLLERKLDMVPPQRVDKMSKEEEEAEIQALEEADEDFDVLFERLLKRAVKTRAGVSEMLILSRASHAILPQDKK